MDQELERNDEGFTEIDSEIAGEEALDGAADDGSTSCFEGDKGDLPPAARRACTELLRKYFISEATEGALFQMVLDNLEDVERCMNNLYLRVKVSKRYRVAYAVSVPDDDLVSGVQRISVKRNAPLKRDETILLVRLRVLQHKLEAEDPENWFVERRDMEEHLMATCYRDDLDEGRVSLRISNAIKTLASYGYIKLVNEDEGRYRIMPVLPAILDLQTASSLMQQVLGKLEPEGDAKDASDLTANSNAADADGHSASAFGNDVRDAFGLELGVDGGKG